MDKIMPNVKHFNNDPCVQAGYWGMVTREEARQAGDVTSGQGNNTGGCVSAFIMNLCARLLTSMRSVIIFRLLNK